MKFKKTPVKQVRIDAMCDKCDGGVYVATGENTGTLPGMLQSVIGGLKHMHRCNICKTERLSQDIWPRIVYEDDGPGEIFEPVIAAVAQSNARHTHEG